MSDQYLCTVTEEDGIPVYALASDECAAAVTINRAVELQREGVPFKPLRGVKAADFPRYFPRDWR
jgi:hypothetical protein